MMCAQGSRSPTLFLLAYMMFICHASARENAILMRDILQNLSACP
jgi:hypothetical protein